MNDSTLGVKAILDDLVVPIIAVFEVTKQGICNQISELNEARSSGIDEDRHFSVVPSHPKGVPRILKLSREGLDSLFSR